MTYQAHNCDDLIAKSPYEKVINHQMLEILHSGGTLEPRRLRVGSHGLVGQ